MKGLGYLSTAVAATSLFASSVFASVPPLVIKGKHFFYSNNGTEFFIRGVAYQQDVGGNGTIITGTNGPTSYTDPLADPAGCKRDIPYLAQLRTNTIRVYAVDPTKNHDECMSMLADAGIYVISDLSEPNQSINRDDPSWNYALYNRYTAVIDAFSKYPNVIGFFAGNEVSNTYNTTEASAFVKAAVRDSKAYIKAKGYRSIYVGYATYDGPIREQLAEYFACGDDTANAIDFWGYNVYSWCDPSTYVSSGYQARTEEFASYPVPAFFAEYGCNTGGTRQFQEVQALFGPQMTPVWSGGIVYMYFQEANNYGLVQVNGNSVSKMPDFVNLQNQMEKANPSSTAMSDYTPTGTSTPACPALNAQWSATATPLPPSPNEDLCGCVVDALSCVVSDNVPVKGYKSLFGYICSADNNACDGIAHDAQTGSYGAYSGCLAKQQLSYVMNQYYLDQNSDSSACSFKGSATLRSVATPTGQCSSLISSAGAQGTGTVSGPAPSSTTSKGAAANVVVPKFDFGLVQMGLYVAAAIFSGAGMLLL